MTARTAVLLLPFALLCTAAPVSGQAAAPWLPADHWTGQLLVRLHAAGAAAGDPVRWLRTEADAGVALRLYAVRSAAARSRVQVGPRMQLETAVRLTTRGDAVGPAGHTLDREWTGPRVKRDLTSPGVRVRAAAVPRSWLALTTELVAAPGSAVVEHATITAAAGRFDAWAGRRAVGYRAGAGGGLVLHGLRRFDGAGARLARAVEVPLLGAVTGEAFGGPLERNGHVARPWLIGMRVHARPHPRLDAGATRAAVFGGLGGARVGVSELAQVLVAANLDGDFADDQVASVDARWRPPLGGLAAELYGEWGMHDIDAEVLIDVPAFTVGVRMPRVASGARGELGLGVEHTQISGSCCGNPPWYHHFELADGWATDGTLLGHPLGGQGREWRLLVTAASRGASVLLDTGVALRTRGAENLFAPARQGRAALYDARADVQLADRLGAELRLTAERGAGWSELRSAAAVRWRM